MPGAEKTTALACENMLARSVLKKQHLHVDNMLAQPSHGEKTQKMRKAKKGAPYVNAACIVYTPMCLVISLSSEETLPRHAHIGSEATPSTCRLWLVARWTSLVVRSRSTIM